MKPSYYRLKQFLSENDVKKLLQIAYSVPDNEWYVHRSTQSGELSPLHFYGLSEKFMGRKSLLLMIKPGAIQKWHTDMKGRNTVLIYPLTENYAPCLTEEGEVSFPAFINTQRKHAVYNNDNIRINLQVQFDENINECIDIFEKAESYEFDTSRL